MSETIAVPLSYLAEANGERLPPEGQGGRPLCPACPVGRLQPYLVTICLTTNQMPWHGADTLQGWVAVCVGAKAADGVAARDFDPCGFSLPMTPHRWPS